MKPSAVCKALFCGFCCLGLLFRTTGAAAVSKKDLELMEKKVQEQNIEHRKLQAQANQINIELASVSQDMITTAKKIQNSEEKLSAMEDQLAKLQDSLKKTEESFSQEDQNLIRTLSALQNLALKPTEALFVQPLTPVEIIRSAMLLRETVPYLEENAERIRLELEQISHKKELVEKQVWQISNQKKIMEKDHERMKLLVQKKSKIRNAVEIESVKAQRNIQKLASQAKDLKGLLDKLEKERQQKAEAERKRQEELRRIEEERRAKSKKEEETQRADLIKYNQEVISEVGKGFAKAKGKLSMPAKGTVVTAYGEQKVKGVTSKGIMIKTRNEAQVIAPYDGTVAFAGPFRGYGNLIIIEHGDGYLSLLAGLGSLDCEVGQLLLAGEPVGQMPDSKDSKLYVEMRRNNNPINPLKWMRN
ncbi:MAG: peptidoglycan DD-metalloendopeptidase family protein [Alphaproteobacteria bacterium]|nr:peptidoglycan DD-metalloendopeptidase family protein [Alphaproteobacteria bacterium]